MTSIALHPAPRWQTVAREQLRAVGLALRAEGMLFLGALGVIAVLMIISAVRMAAHPGQNMSIGYVPQATIPMALVAFVIPFSVWRSEDPARRSYHWAMPVARSPHTLTKAASGWLWLMAAVAVYLLYIVALSMVVSAITGDPRGGRSIPAWEWVIPFTSATVAYLLGSTAVLASDHPWRWIMGVIVTYVVILLVLLSMDRTDDVRMWGGIVDGYHGLRTALFGYVRVRHVGASASRWLSATAIWGALGVIGVAGALFRRGDD